VLDPQSDLGLSHRPAVESRARRSDPPLEAPGRAGAPVTGATGNAYAIWKFARNPEAALAFLHYYAEHLAEAFQASTGFNNPVFANVLPQPMPILSDDPTSHPPDKLAILQNAGEWHAAYGYPGPAGAAAGEVANAFIIPDMMAAAATDKMAPEEAVAWADKQIHGIYRKWVA
jgi:multiple sugar transport system substrate-binding protein